MSQYFFSCMECAETLELGHTEQVDFDLAASQEISNPDIDYISLGQFFLLHRGHALVFTTKE